MLDSVLSNEFHHMHTVVQLLDALHPLGNQPCRPRKPGKPNHHDPSGSARDALRARAAPHATAEERGLQLAGRIFLPEPVSSVLALIQLFRETTVRTLRSVAARPKPLFTRSSSCTSHRLGRIRNAGNPMVPGESALQSGNAAGSRFLCSHLCDGRLDSGLAAPVHRDSRHGTGSPWIGGSHGGSLRGSTVANGDLCDRRVAVFEPRTGTSWHRHRAVGRCRRGVRRAGAWRRRIHSAI